MNMDRLRKVANHHGKAPVAGPQPAARQDALVTGGIPPGRRSVIAQSLRRCRSAGLGTLDPPQRVGGGDLEQRLRSLDVVLRLATPLFQGLLPLCLSPICALFVTNQAGVVLHVMSTGEALPDLALGTRWDEASFGSNGIGLALGLGVPFIVSGAEHYRFSMRGWVSAGTPLRNADGEIFACVGFVAPVSGEPAHALRLCTAAGRSLEGLVTAHTLYASELKHNERLKTIGELSSITAHEVRNPLTAIRATAELGSLVAKPGEKSQELFERIVRGVDRLDVFIGELLSLGKPDVGDHQLGHVEEAVRGVVMLVQAKLMAHRIEAFTEFEPDLPPVRFSERLIRQALLNLILNAIESMPSGGRLLLSVRWVTPDDLVTLPLPVDVEAHLRPGVLLCVSDTGIGIAEELQPKVFRSPFTTKGENGTGLGLCITRQIIEDEHRGLIWFHSTSGRGTCFYILLPTDQAAPKQTPHAEHPPSRPR